MPVDIKIKAVCLSLQGRYPSLSFHKDVSIVINVPPRYYLIKVSAYETSMRMNNEIREKDHEWVKMFHSNIDRLLVSIEKLFESRQPGAFNDELLIDKEVAHILKVSRRTLQDYRNNGILSYIQVGGKILYRTSDVQRTIMSGFKEAYRLKDT